jgi:hypothetical protein
LRAEESALALYLLFPLFYAPLLDYPFDARAAAAGAAETLCELATLRCPSSPFARDTFWIHRAAGNAKWLAIAGGVIPSPPLWLFLMSVVPRV